MLHGVDRLAVAPDQPGRVAAAGNRDDARPVLCHGDGQLGIDGCGDALDDVAHALGDGPERGRRDLCARKHARRLASHAHQAALALAHRDELDVVLGERPGQLAQRLQGLLPSGGHIVACALGLERAQFAAHQRFRERPAPCSPLPPLGFGMREVRSCLTLGGAAFGGGPMSLRSAACCPTVQRLVAIQ